MPERRPSRRRRRRERPRPTRSRSEPASGHGAVSERSSSSCPKASNARRTSRSVPRDLVDRVERATISAGVRERAVTVLTRLGEAEARVHGVPFDEVHLEELGSDDTLVDVVGVAAALDAIDVRSIAVAPLPALRQGARATHRAPPRVRHVSTSCDAPPCEAGWSPSRPTARRDPRRARRALVGGARDAARGRRRRCRHARLRRAWPTSFASCSVRRTVGRGRTTARRRRGQRGRPLSRARAGRARRRCCGPARSTPGPRRSS